MRNSVGDKPPACRIGGDSTMVLNTAAGMRDDPVRAGEIGSSFAGNGIDDEIEIIYT